MNRSRVVVEQCVRWRPVPTRGASVISEVVLRFNNCCNRAMVKDQKEMIMNDRLKSLSVLPGIGGLESPVRNVLGEPIGLPDPASPPGMRPMEGTFVRDVVCNLAGQVTSAGTIGPPPKVGSSRSWASCGGQSAGAPARDGR